MIRTILAAAFVLLCISTRAQQVDLKTYYEQQKAAILPTFSPPELGSQVTINLKAGQSRTGVLMKLDTASLSIMADTGSMITYQRNAIQEVTRTKLFAEDYAHTKALEKTRIYKDQQNQVFQAEQEAGVHDGSISVVAKTSKKTDTEKKEDKREIKSRGETITITTTTKTYTENQQLGVTITNKSGHPDKYVVEYYFFGESVSKGGPQQNKKKEGKKSKESESAGVLKIHENGSKSVTVAGRGREKIELTSKDFEVKKVQVDTGSGHSGNAPKENGIESAGYLVILKYGSTVLDKKASARAYLADDWLRKVK